MRKVLQTALLIGVFAAATFSQPQTSREIPPANRNLVPRDFTLDDEQLSLKLTLPVRLYVNGREFPVGWAIARGRTMWLGRRGHGGYMLSLTPFHGCNIKKSGTILDHAIVFQVGGDDFELRFSRPNRWCWCSMESIRGARGLATQPDAAKTR